MIRIKHQFISSSFPCCRGPVIAASTVADNVASEVSVLIQRLADLVRNHFPGINTASCSKHKKTNAWCQLLSTAAFLFFLFQSLRWIFKVNSVVRFSATAQRTRTEAADSRYHSLCVPCIAWFEYCSCVTSSSKVLIYFFVKLVRRNNRHY